MRSAPDSLVARWSIAAAASLAIGCDDPSGASTQIPRGVPAINTPDTTTGQADGGVSRTGTARDTRCRTEVATFSPRAAWGDVVGAFQGETGLRVFTERGWWDAATNGPTGVDVAPRRVVAVAGGYLFATESGVQFRDATTHAMHAARGTIARGCEPQWVATAAGAVLFQRRVAGGTCDEPRTLGPIVAQRVDGQGAPVGVPTTLGSTHDRLARVTSFTVRRDAGRIVLEAMQDDDRPAVVVLDDDLRELGFVDADELSHGTVACPRAGCVRIEGAVENGDPGTAVDAAGHMRLADLGTGGEAEIEAPNGTWQDVATFGDLILLRIWTAAGERAQALVVINAAHRRTMPVYDAPHDTTVTRLVIAGVGTRSVLGVTGRGFVVSGVDESLGPFVQEIRCEP